MAVSGRLLKGICVVTWAISSALQHVVLLAKHYVVPSSLPRPMLIQTKRISDWGPSQWRPPRGSRGTHPNPTSAEDGHCYYAARPLHESKSACWLLQTSDSLEQAFARTALKEVDFALQICCQSADLGDLWGRWSAHKRFEDYLTCPAEVIGRLGSMLGEGCYGRVYKLYRASGNNANLTLSHPTSCVFIEGHRGAWRWRRLVSSLQTFLAAVCWRPWGPPGPRPTSQTKFSFVASRVSRPASSLPGGLPRRLPHHHKPFLFCSHFPSW